MPFVGTGKDQLEATMGIPKVSIFNNKFLVDSKINQDNELVIKHANSFDFEQSYDEVFIDSYIAKSLGKYTDGKLCCHEWTRNGRLKFENLTFVRKGEDILNQSIFIFDNMRDVWDESLKEKNIPRFDNMISWYELSAD